MLKLCFVPVVLLCVHSTAALAGPDFSVLSQQLQQNLNGRPAFQGSVLVRQGEQVLWQYHKGEQQGRSFNQHSSFFVGSISKTLAATLVMQQVQAGKLDLQAAVSRYLPDLKQQWASTVRVADLLSHSSGLIDIDTQQNYGQFRYNNLNFQLLGQILTAVTQRPYAELAQQLLQQCKMADTGFTVKADTVSQGWHEEQGKLKVITGFMPEQAQPSGGLISSVTDVAALPYCMQQQLSKTSLQQMTTPYVQRQHRWGQVYYGYGVQITQTAAGIEWSHGGYIPGYVSAFHYFPQYQLSLVVLENQSMDAADLARATYYHDQIRDSVIQLLSQQPKD